MFELLTNIGECIKMELDEVQDIDYIKELNNVLILIMNSGKKYTLTLSQTD